MKITTPIRTLVDLVSEGKIGAELIKQAVSKAQTRTYQSETNRQESRNNGAL